MTTTTGRALRDAVRAWLDGLGADATARARFPFDTDERFAWDYRPVPREGLAIASMTDPQRAAAWSTAELALSPRAVAEARSIVALEPILGAIERAAGGGGPVRDPERYWFAVFGEPGDPAGWSWRLGGHHLAIQLTLVDDEVVGSAPSFFGANPAIVPGGPSAGARALPGEELLARELLHSLTSAQRAVAVVDDTAPADIRTESAAHADPRDVPHGIRHADLTPDQQGRLEGLIRHYLGRAADDVATAEWARAIGEDLASISFAWAGGQGPGEAHYYAIRGQRLLIEYDDTQNGANHIHAVWRDLANDYGEDALAAHYRAAHP